MAKVKNKVYDYVIVGSGLSGLIVGSYVSRCGASVLLVESGDIHMGAPSGAEGLKPELNFMAATAENHENINWLQNTFAVALEAEEQSLPPRTFEGGEFKPFLGFGDRKFQSTDELTYFNQSNVLVTKDSPYQWWQQINERYQGERLSPAEVTNLTFDGNTLKSIQINGATDIEGHNFIFSHSPKELSELIPGEVNFKGRQKFAKTRSWTAVTLEFTHSHKQTDDYGLNFLMGSKDDAEPLVGRFFAANEEGEQKSQWVSLIMVDLAEDDELVGGVIRHMKRQIKRAYPEAFENLKWEKITIHPFSHGHIDLTFKSPGLIGDFKNLYLVSHLTSAFHGLAGMLNSAISLVNSLELPGELSPTPEETPLAQPEASC